MILVLWAVIPLLGLTLFRYVEQRQTIVAETKDNALRLARLLARDQQDSIRDTRQLLFALTQIGEVQGDDPAACARFFARLLQEYPQYLLLGVIDPAGNIFCSAYPTSGPVNVADQPYFQQVLQTHDFAISNYQSDALSNKATLNFGYPVLTANREIQAVVFASLDLTWLNQLPAEANLPPGTTFTVIDRHGTILVRYPDPELWVGQSLPESPIINLILSQQGEGTAEAEGVDGIPRLFAFTPLNNSAGNGDVFVSIGIPTTVAFAAANQTLTRNLVGLAVVTLLALSAAWVGGKWFILRWIDALVEATKRLSSGDLTARTGLPYETSELSQLAVAFDNMAESLECEMQERDRAEAALHETQRALSTLLSNLPGMAYRARHDWERTMEFVSEGCLELTGYPPAELGSYRALIHQDDRQRVWNNIQAAVAEKQPFRLSYRLLPKSGEERWAWEQGRGVFSPSGDLLALEGFIIDATERVLAYQNLEERVADRTQALLALYNVTAVASESLDLETVLERSLDQVLGVIGSKIGVIHLYNEEDQILELAAWRGLSAGEVGKITLMPVGQGMSGWVIAEGKPILIPDISADSRPILVPSHFGSRAFIGGPLRAKGRILGVLGLVGEPDRQFNAEDLALLDSIAGQIGVAVDNARLYQQAEQLAVMNERSRLARDLHDSVTQSLYSVTLLAEAARRSAEGKEFAQVKHYLSQLSEAVRLSLKEMRLLVYELRPLDLEEEGLVGALQHRLDAVEGRAGVQARLLVEGELVVPVALEEGLYRIAQEALNNALKHARATLVTVKLQSNQGQISLAVVDNGVGFDPAAVGQSGGLGLVSMRERTEQLNGSLTIESAPGMGTTVKVIFTGLSPEVASGPAKARDAVVPLAQMEVSS
jgi:signal transduction histidine kinase